MESTLKYSKITRKMTRDEAEEDMFNFVDGNELPLVTNCPMRIILIQQPTGDETKCIGSLGEVDYMHPGKAGHHLWDILQLNRHEVAAFTVFDHIAGILTSIIAAEEFIDEAVKNMTKKMKENAEKLMGDSISKLEI